MACCPQPSTGITQSIPGLASARRPLRSGPALSGQGDGLLDCGRLCRQQGNNLHQEAAAVSSRGSWAGVLSNMCLIKTLRSPGPLLRLWEAAHWGPRFWRAGGGGPSARSRLRFVLRSGGHGGHPRAHAGRRAQPHSLPSSLGSGHGGRLVRGPRVRLQQDELRPGRGCDHGPGARHRLPLVFGGEALAGVKEGDGFFLELLLC